jgi:lipopolysaccharide export system permease protein
MFKIKKIDRYILKATTIPLLVTLGISALLLLLEKMLTLFDFVINEGGPIDIVWRMLGNLMPQYLTLVLPLAMFLGVLLAIRNLAMNSELDALLSAGMSLPRLLAPSMGIAIILLIINIVIVGFVQPYSRYAYQGLVFDVQSGALGASIKSGQFTHLGKGLTIRIEESLDSGKELVDLFVQKESDDGQVTSFSARKGQFFASPDGKHLILRLYDGQIINLDSSQKKPRVGTFALQDLPIKLPNFKSFRGRGAEAREMTFIELWNVRNKEDNTEIIAILHSRIARALSILLVPFLGIPLGLVAKRSGKALGISVGIIMLLTYHKTLEFGRDFAIAGDISPYVSIWIPTLIFALITARLFYIGAYKVGGVPLRRLEIITESTIKLIVRIIKRFKKTPPKEI